MSFEIIVPFFISLIATILTLLVTKFFFSEFVGAHYALSHRDDTEYWRHIQNKNWLVEENRGMWKLANAKMLQHNFAKQGGIHAIAAGMHYSPTDLSEIMWQTLKDKEALGREWAPFIKNLNTVIEKINNQIS